MKKGTRQPVIQYTPLCKGETRSELKDCSHLMVLKIKNTDFQSSQWMEFFIYKMQGVTQIKSPCAWENFIPGKYRVKTCKTKKKDNKGKKKKIRKKKRKRK